MGQNAVSEECYSEQRHETVVENRRTVQEGRGYN